MKRIVNNLPQHPSKISYNINKNISIFIRKNIIKKVILNRNYYSYEEAYGEYSQEEGRYILALAKTNFNQAFEIVASWEKEKSLPE